MSSRYPIHKDWCRVSHDGPCLREDQRPPNGTAAEVVKCPDCGNTLRHVSGEDWACARCKDPQTQSGERYWRVASSPDVAALLAQLAAAREQVTSLRSALIAHRRDLHNWSNRPCPTCRTSARALGIGGKVPDSCALGDADAAALAATPEPR